MNTISDSIRLVIALDFGTTRSGYAYAFTDDRKVNVPKNWPGEPGPYAKTLTELLVTERGIGVEADDDWGWLARHKLAKLRGDRRARNCDLVRTFKMRLFDAQSDDLARGPLYESKRAAYPVVDLIAAYLRRLKSHALNEIRRGTFGHLESTDILWCLTVPAIWSATHKRLMRVAAQRAEIVDDYTDEEHLRIVLEPEAAAHYCQRELAQEWAPGMRLMIVDAGGGTLDLTAYRVNAQRRLDELVTGAGGSWGSTAIDREFLRAWLPRRLNGQAIDEYHDVAPVDYLEHILFQWERKKCDFDPIAGRVSDFALPTRLYKLLGSKYPDALRHLAEVQDGEDDVVRLDVGAMADLFRPTLDGVVGEINQMLDRIRANGEDVDVMYVVGGFAASPMLMQRLEEEFGAKVVRRPPDPGAAVVQGAVASAFDPAIASRRSRLTYGIAAALPFEEGIDPPSKKTKSDWNTVLCDQRFLVFVQAGDAVPVDQEVTHPMHALKLTDTKISLRLFSTLKRDPRYVDEADVSFHTDILIQRPAGERSKWEFNVSMYFGRSEIEFVVRDQSTGNPVKGTIRMSGTYAPELLGHVD